MPGGDGTGPLGLGAGTGRGRGRCRGGGVFGRGGRNGWRRGAGIPAEGGDTAEPVGLAAEVAKLGRRLADMESKLKGQGQTGDERK